MSTMADKLDESLEDLHKSILSLCENGETTHVDDSDIDDDALLETLDKQAQALTRNDNTVCIDLTDQSTIAVDEGSNHEMLGDNRDATLTNGTNFVDCDNHESSMEATKYMTLDSVETSLKLMKDGEGAIGNLSPIKLNSDLDDLNQALKPSSSLLKCHSTPLIGYDRHNILGKENVKRKRESSGEDSDFSLGSVCDSDIEDLGAIDDESYMSLLDEITALCGDDTKLDDGGDKKNDKPPADVNVPNISKIDIDSLLFSSNKTKVVDKGSELSRDEEDILLQCGDIPGRFTGLGLTFSLDDSEVDETKYKTTFEIDDDSNYIAEDEETLLADKTVLDNSAEGSELVKSFEGASTQDGSFETIDEVSDTPQSSQEDSKAAVVKSSKEGAVIDLKNIPVSVEKQKELVDSKVPKDGKVLAESEGIKIDSDDEELVIEGAAFIGSDDDDDLLLSDDEDGKQLGEEEKEKEKKKDKKSMVENYEAERKILISNSSLVTKLIKKWKTDGIQSPDINLTFNTSRREANTNIDDAFHLEGDMVSPLIKCLDESEIENPDEPPNKKQKLDRVSRLPTTDEVINNLRGKIRNANREYDIELENIQYDEMYQLQEARLEFIHCRENLIANQQEEMIIMKQKFHSGMFPPDQVRYEANMLKMDHETQRCFLKSQLDERFFGIKQKFSEIRGNSEVKYNEKLEKLNSLMSQLQSNNAKGEGLYTVADLKKGPCRTNALSLSRVSVCLPADVASIIMEEDELYDSLYNFVLR